MEHVNTGDNKQNQQIHHIHHSWTEIHSHRHHIFTQTVHQIADRGFFEIRQRKFLVMVVDFIFEFVFNLSRCHNDGLPHHKGEKTSE
ncbi:hypothetical protein SDC9_188137 [bioreactor metagenome]|uniref:Uncharacterized protein n=1 Tax=bioreactor metagenome TaxID=1076179 RepID=A0A645HQT4_9ZZZZ